MSNEKVDLKKSVSCSLKPRGSPTIWQRSRRSCWSLEHSLSISLLCLWIQRKPFPEHASLWDPGVLSKHWFGGRFGKTPLSRLLPTVAEGKSRRSPERARMWTKLWKLRKNGNNGKEKTWFFPPHPRELSIVYDSLWWQAWLAPHKDF